MAGNTSRIIPCRAGGVNVSPCRDAPRSRGRAPGGAGENSATTREPCWVRAGIAGGCGSSEGAKGDSSGRGCRRDVHIPRSPRCLAGRGAPPSRRLQCLREGIMAPHIPACRAGCPHPAKPPMPRGAGRSSLPKAPMPSGGYHGPTHPGLPGGMSTSREARGASRDGDRSSLPKAPMPSGGYHGPTHPGLPGGMSTSREARGASRDGDRSSLPKAPMPSGGYHGPTHPGLPGGVSTSREAPDASRDGDVPPTGEALSRGRSGSQALPWPLRYEPFRRKRGAIHLHFRPAPSLAPALARGTVRAYNAVGGTRRASAGRWRTPAV